MTFDGKKAIEMGNYKSTLYNYTFKMPRQGLQVYRCLFPVLMDSSGVTSFEVAPLEPIRYLA